ncbi:hypothetical protein GVAV_001959 [Gurleya vavrai]
MIRSLFNLSILINVFRFENVEFQTFETMFNESIDVMDEKQKLYNVIKENFEGKIIICFTIPDGIFLGLTVVEMQKYLFDCFSIEDPQSSLLAFETKYFSEYTDTIRNTRVVEFFNKIYTKIQNPNLKIEKISPYISFGIKYKGNEKIPNGVIAPNITKEYIFDYEIYQDQYDKIDCIDDDFKFTSVYQDFFLSFYSNFELSKTDFEFCKKFYIKNIAKITETEHIGFFVLKSENNNLEIYKNIFNDLCNKTKKKYICDTIKLKFIQCFFTSKPKELFTSDKSSPISSSFLFLQKIYAKIFQFSYYLKKKLKMLIETNIEKNLTCQLESLYLNFSIETLFIASEEAKNIIKDYLPLGIINKIYHVKLNWLFGDQNIYFYKVSEDLKTNNCQEIKKITILTIAENINCKQFFDFFYFENYDGTIIQEYKFESVKKSQQKFKIFFKNLNRFFTIVTFEKIYCEFNVFYFLLVETDLRVFDGKYFKVFTFSNIGISFTDYSVYLYEKFKKHLYNVTLYKTDFLNSKNLEELFFLNTICIYKNIRRNIVDIEKDKDLLDKNFCYKIELKLNENEIFYFDILPHINFDKESVFYKLFVTKSKIKIIFNNFTVQNKKSLSENLNIKLKYEDSNRIQYYNDRQEFFDIINHKKTVELLNNIIDEINETEFFSIFKKSFLDDDKICGRYISEFLTTNSEFLLDFAYKHIDKNAENIKNERLIFEKAYAFQNIFFFILNQTRYEIIFNYIDTREKLDIIVSWYQHNNSLQNSKKIIKFLENLIQYNSNRIFEFKHHKILKFI